MTGDKEYEFGKKVTLLNNPLTKEKNWNFKTCPDDKNTAYQNRWDAAEQFKVWEKGWYWL